ncbi:IPK1 (YDR315C) [Zygosaccharomyces parabailii]|nr:IPK1 (YDR315C) [Zygosaccharomyces parabailii]
MRIVGRGGANLLIDYGNPGWLYRCCIRFSSSLRLCNQYTKDNVRFINEKVRPILLDMLCCMELQTVSLNKLQVLNQYITELDDGIVQLIKIQTLKNESLDQLIYRDHLTSFYCSGDDILMEFKPKWLYSKLGYCRNCAYNSLKNRDISYCYVTLLNEPRHFFSIVKQASLPREFVEDIIGYFSSSDNILRVLHDAQKKLDVQPWTQIGSASDVDDQCLLCMTLRDVTCFIRWHPNSPVSVSVVDVDLKPREKWEYWIETYQMLNSYVTTHHSKKH